MPAQQKVTKRLAPSVRHLAKARCSLAPVSIRGRRNAAESAALTALRATPLMNTSTRPAEGAGRSKARSKAKAKARRPTGRPACLSRLYQDPMWERACSRWHLSRHHKTSRPTEIQHTSSPRRIGCLPPRFQPFSSPRPPLSAGFSRCRIRQ